uniref:MD-2-related lipid-recognition domain-containing protein n=1 Tax=Stomoxys calcitrans TaxID=35570 RepID=A0A1I8PHH7_STOCA
MASGKIAFGILGAIIALIFSTNGSKSIFKFTNIKCQDHDVNFSRAEVCKLRVIGRGVVTLNIRVGLYKIPVTNVTVNMGFYKKANGFKPFLYNYTVDFCNFMTNRKRYPVMKVLFDVFLHASNINHSCPFDHAIVIDNLLLEESKFELFPIPEGEYMFKLMVFAYNDLKATLETYFYRKISYSK